MFTPHPPIVANHHADLLLVPTWATENEIAQIRATMELAVPGETQRTYHAHVRMFEQWCKRRGLPFTADGSTPAHHEWLLVHLNDVSKAGRTLHTITGRVTALNRWHHDRALQSPGQHPLVVEWLKGNRHKVAELNANGIGISEETPGVLRDDIRAMVQTIDTTTLAGLRDRAMLLVGWYGAFRRSELVSVVVENVAMDPTGRGRGMLVRAYNTKTNKATAQTKVVHTQPNDVELCAVNAYTEWVNRAGITSGPVFRRIDKAGNIGRCYPSTDTTKRNRSGNPDGRVSARFVDLIVRQYAERAGVGGGLFSAHSLRSGYATQAKLDGVGDAEIRAQGWADNSTVVYRYQRRTDPFDLPRHKV